MNACSDPLSGSQSFSIDVRKVEGGYQARSEGTTVPPTLAATEGDAIQQHTKALYDAMSKGTLFSTEGRV